MGERDHPWTSFYAARYIPNTFSAVSDAGSKPAVGGSKTEKIAAGARIA
jgi:hypothetical protein